MKEYRNAPLSIEVQKYEREFTESGKALIKEIISKTPYTEAPRCPNPNGTLCFGMPAIDNDGTSYWIEVTGWEEPVIGYRCGNGEGCFAVEDFRADNVKNLSILQVLCKYKIVQKNLFKWTELNSVRFYVIRKISTCQ